MPPSTKINYLKGLAICHGKSEVCMVKYIGTNLHLNVRQYSKNNGKNSIQITGLMSILNNYPFDSINSLAKAYPVEVLGRGVNKKVNEFKLFIIMDTDDCTPQQKRDFISKQMFNGHWLFDYIVPIYNDPKLEDVLLQSGIISKKIKNSEKGTLYERIFPINSKPFSNDTLLEVTTFKQKICSNPNTNMDVFVDYCIDLLS